MLIGASKAGDISGGASHVKANQLKLVAVAACPLGCQGIPHVSAARRCNVSKLAVAEQQSVEQTDQLKKLLKQTSANQGYVQNRAK